jgi:predicted NBD/HSP70 family sugar kinase
MSASPITVITATSVADIRCDESPAVHQDRRPVLPETGETFLPETGNRQPPVKQANADRVKLRQYLADFRYNGRRTRNLGAVTEPPPLRPSDRQLLAILRQHGQLRRSELAQLSGLPRSTITDATTRLERAGIVVERPMPPAAGFASGRPPKLLAVATPPGMVGVLALTHGTLQAGVVSFDGTVRAREAVDAYPSDLVDGVIGPGLALLDEALRGISCTRDALACAVIGLPLPVVPGRGLGGPLAIQADSAGPRPRPQRRPLPAWVNTDPSIELGQRLGIPAWLENDANLGALGEADYGAAAGMTDFIYIKVVQGIGAGLILDGRLHRGANGLAGEIAHIHLEDDGAVCYCGGRGCLATTLNTVRLVDLIRVVHPSASTMADVLALAADGDAGVWRLLRDLGRTIGRSLADFCVYVAPDGVVVDGLLQNASSPVIDGVNEMLRQSSPSAIASQVQVVAGTLGSDAELRGAATLARQNQFGPLLC